jgi:hypothetical protein
VPTLVPHAIVKIVKTAGDRPCGTRWREVRVFARVSHVQYPPQHYDAGMQVVINDLLPALQQALGYRGCCLLSGSKPGTGLGVVLWESEEAADAAASDSGVLAAHVTLAGLGLVIEERKIYDVVAQDVGGLQPARTEGGFPHRSECPMSCTDGVAE